MEHRDLIKAAREWIADCYWTDLDPDDVADLNDDEVQHGVSLHYDGGWEQFVRDVS